MQKLITLSLIVMGAFFVTACGDSSNSNDGGTTADGGASQSQQLATKCEDPKVLTNSCLNELGTCFKPEGACTVKVDKTTGNSTVTWANGAKAETKVSVNTSGIDPTKIKPGEVPNVNVSAGADTTYSSGGKTCYTGKTTVNATGGAGGGSGTSTTEISYNGKKWIIKGDSTGAITITCPDGKTENIPAANAGCANNPAGGECKVEGM
ncbi:MAG: hypothetical protein GMKNLPBB_00317 [Myxococcota bacterium]|nr:hypothetical protein [Myxococcota bacterium]